MATFKPIHLNPIERKILLKQAEDIYKCTNFSKDEVENLLYKYRCLSPDGKIDRVKFRDLLHDHFSMSDDYFMDRVFRAFDKDSDGYVSMEEWVVGLSVFLRGSLDEKMIYCFSIYDLNDDGYISREEMFQMLKNTMVKQPTEEDPDEGIKDLVETMIKRMDIDHDSKVSLEDYMTSIREQTLLIEGFGPCLPTSNDVNKFSKLLFETDSYKH